MTTNADTRPDQRVRCRCHSGGCGCSQAGRAVPTPPALRNGIKAQVRIRRQGVRPYPSSPALTASAGKTPEQIITAFLDEADQVGRSLVASGSSTLVAAAAVQAEQERRSLWLRVHRPELTNANPLTKLLSGAFLGVESRRRARMADLAAQVRQTRMGAQRARVARLRGAK